MSTPSRTSELRRRRARKEKVILLRKRFAAAKSDADRTRILEKVKKVAPSMSADQFTKALAASKP